MPVLVTGAGGAEGRATVQRLVRSGSEVRLYVDDADEVLLSDWRAVGCKVARGGLDDEAALESALEHVHTVAHLAGGPLTDPGALLDDLATVLSAAIGAGCRRLVVLSDLAVSDPSANPYLQALAEVEALLVDAPLETVVLRRALTYGPHDELTSVLAAGAPPQVAGSSHAAVYADDVAAAVVEADRARGVGGDAHLVIALVGPVDVTLRGLSDLLAGAVPQAPRDLPPHVLDWLGRSPGPPPPDELARMTGPTTPVQGAQRARDEG